MSDFRTGPVKLPAGGRVPWWIVPGICVALAGAVWLVFGQTRGFEFVDYDDGDYVFDNPMVRNGLTSWGIKRAFIGFSASYWHPLGWLSHMLDCQLYGLNAGGHHVTNVILHAATAILLFLALRQLTGAMWRSATVAAIFAIHPLRVESVAWVSERKDVLSGLFFMLTLLGYAHYTRRPRSWPRYLLVMLLLTLALMSKPTTVTLPFVLLLLDYWPLGRFSAEPGARWRVLLEKAPLIALSLCVCVITSLAQRESMGRVPLTERAGNAAISYVAYIGQMFYPARLAVLYPFPLLGLPLWEVIAAVSLLAAISLGILALQHRHRYLLVGWLWYLGMLVPMIGLVQVGSQARADRYTYLPQIGLYILLTWTVADLTAGWRWQRAALGGGTAILLATLMACAHAQTAYWRNSETLWTHTLTITKGNAEPENDLAVSLLREGRVDDAIAQFRLITERYPSYATGFFNLGVAVKRKGRLDEAVADYKIALKLRPDMPEAHYDLGAILAQRGQLKDAISHFNDALAIEPDFTAAHIDLGMALFLQGNVDGAIEHWRKALDIDPGSAKAYYHLGTASYQRGDMNTAIADWEKALGFDPGLAEVHFTLGKALIEKGQIDAAINQLNAGIQIKPGDAEAHYQLGMALLKKKQVRDALAEWQKASELDPGNGVVQNQIAWVLATWPDQSIRDGTRALAFAEEAAKILGPNDASALDTLAAAQAECGHFPDAIETAKKAMATINGKDDNQAALAADIEKRIKLFESHLPFRGE